MFPRVLDVGSQTCVRNAVAWQQCKHSIIERKRQQQLRVAPLTLTLKWLHTVKGPPHNSLVAEVDAKPRPTRPSCSAKLRG
jgi:hypothetical protein